VKPVLPIWRGETAVCIGGGPSLKAEDVAFVRGRARVIAINDAVKLAQWADVLYVADRSFIDAHDGMPRFAGLKYSLSSSNPTDRPDWTVLDNTGMFGLETDPSGLRTGFNGGYQSLGLAYHLGAKRCLLLGFDMKLSADGREHWFTDTPDRKRSPYPQMIAAFDSIVEPLKDDGVDVVNCTPGSALSCFPKMLLRDALQVVEA